ALASLALEADGARCGTRAGDLLVDRHSDGAYAVLRFEAACAGARRALAVRYGLFAELDPQHRGLLRVEGAGGAIAAGAGGAGPGEEFALRPPAPARAVRGYAPHGIQH